MTNIINEEAIEDPSSDIEPEATERSPEEETAIVTQSIIPAITPPPAPSYDHLDQDAATLDEERIRLAELFGNKKLLIKERTAQLQGKWWQKIAEDLDSDDPFTRRFAMSEFNKIQIKLMPTTLSNDPENPLTPTLNNDERTKIANSIDEIVGFVRRQE